MNKILEDLNWRYATKLFDPIKEVSAENIDTIKEAINLTASSYGLQPFEILLISTQELKTKLWPQSYNQTQVRDASHVIVICNYTKLTEDQIDDYLKHISTIRNLNLSKLEEFGSMMKSDLLKRSQEEIENWASKQCYIVLGNILNVCARLKIDSCPMEGFNPDAYNEILELKSQNLNACLVVPIGYRSDKDINQNFTKVRRPTKELIKEL